MEGCLIRIGAFSNLTHAEITLDLAKDVLRNIIKTEERSVPIESIQKAVASYFNLKISDLKAKKKTKQIVLARQIAIYLSRKLSKLSLIEIGERFGGKDHSTVLHAVNKIDGKMRIDQKLIGIIEEIKSRLAN